MGLQPRPLPRFGDEVVMDLQDTPEFPRTPVGAPVGRRLARPLQDPGFHHRRQHGRRLAAIPCAQTVQHVDRVRPATLEGHADVAAHRR